MTNQHGIPQDDVIQDVAEKSPVKRPRKTKVKEVSATLFGIAPYQEKKNEEYMSENQLLHFKQILEAWKAELLSGVDRTISSMQDESVSLPDVNDRASQEEEFNIELRTRDRERRLINKIEKSIQTIHNEDYGYCDTCGIEIGLRRLEARPTATLCIDCKTLAEIKEKQNNG